MTYSTHRGFVREPTIHLTSHAYYNDSIDYSDLDYERQVYKDEAFNSELEALELAGIALALKQRKGR